MLLVCWWSYWPWPRVLHRPWAWPAPLFSRKFHTRADWEIDTGDVADREASQQVTVYTASGGGQHPDHRRLSRMSTRTRALPITTRTVQDRLAYTLLQLTQEGKYTLESPLAILNPFGTGSNGLYLYFGTSNPTQCVLPPWKAEGYPSYSATANNAGENGFSRVQEFLLIGLVPGRGEHRHPAGSHPSGSGGRPSPLPSTCLNPPPAMTPSWKWWKGNVDPTELSNGLFYAMGFGRLLRLYLLL